MVIKKDAKRFELSPGFGREVTEEERFDKQCKIADVLSSIDDKIATNTAINNNLVA